MQDDDSDAYWAVLERRRRRKSFAFDESRGIWNVPFGHEARLGAAPAAQSDSRFHVVGA